MLYIFTMLYILSCDLLYPMEDKVENKKAERVSKPLIDEIGKVLAQADSNASIKSIDTLSDPERRNLVLRIHVVSPNKLLPETLILKQTYVAGPDEDQEDTLARFAHDWVGLEFLTAVGSRVAPRFYGGSEALKFVLLEDLGQPHVSLVDSLTTGDLEKAIAALHRFMNSLAKMHGESFGHTEKYVEILNRLNPELSKKSAERTTEVFEEYRKELPEIFPKIEFPWTQIKYVLRSIFEPGPFTTFNHVDIAPDNTFDNPLKNELRIFDFEHGIICNLLDAVYLRMSMPTAWCAKSIPDEILKELDATYRMELQKHIPAAKDDETYYTAYTNACAFWMINTLQDVPEVMGKDKIRDSDKLPEGSLWNESENWSRPRIITRLQTFIRPVA